MRVTRAVREYVHQVVLAKVADKLEAAEDAADEARAVYIDKVKKAEALCRKMCAETQAKFAKEVKKLGLTLISDAYSYNGSVSEGGNCVVFAQVNSDDFAETVPEDRFAAKHNPNAERERYCKTVDEPQRIKDAANAVADKLLFELELGKVAKGELDEMLKKLEVEL